MPYQVELIKPDEKQELFDQLKDELFYERKANIFGMCIKLYTNSRRIKDSWEDNFYFMSEFVKSHGRVIAYYDLKEEGKEVKYDPLTNTAFLENVTYYGYVKSIALGVAGDIFEEEHDIHSVHGAVLDIDGKGVSIIAPSGTGKTTHAFGLLQLEKARLISDDWYFVRIFGDDAIATSSEKNCYIRDDLGKIWPQFKNLLEKVKMDKEKRAVADVRWIVGKGHVRESTAISKVILLKRDEKDEKVVRRLSTDDALEYLIGNSFFNPHLLVRNERKMRIRTDFFRAYLEGVDSYLVNTVKSPMETQNEIRKIVLG